MKEITALQLIFASNVYAVYEIEEEKLTLYTKAPDGAPKAVMHLTDVDIRNLLVTTATEVKLYDQPIEDFDDASNATRRH